VGTTKCVEVERFSHLIARHHTLIETAVKQNRNRHFIFEVLEKHEIADWWQARPNNRKLTVVIESNANTGV